MEAQKLVKENDWHTILADEVERPSDKEIGALCRPHDEIRQVNTISHDSDAFSASHGPIENCVPDDPLDPRVGISEATNSPLHVSTIAKLFIFLIAALTAAIVIPWFFRSNHVASEPKSLRISGDHAKFSTPAGTGNGLRGEAYATTSAADVPTGLGVRFANEAEDSTKPAASTPKLSQGSAEAIAQRLQKIELQLRECELILQLLDSRKGVFGGFVPDNNITGISSLANFQEKIVQLEIDKRALGVRFTPNSREIRAIDIEIQGIKSAMRECIEANLRFFQKGRERLLAQKAMLEGGRGPVRSSEKVHNAQLSCSPSNGRWLSWVDNGINPTADRLSVAGRPAAGRMVEFTNRAQARISTVSGENSGARSKRARNWSRLAGSGPDKLVRGRIGSIRADQSENSVRSFHKDSRIRHRVVSPTASAERPPGLVNPTQAGHLLGGTRRDTNGCYGRW